jgi:hypothetical protein
MQQDLQRIIDMSKDWPKKISVIPSSTAQKHSAQFRLCGLLTAKERQQIMNDSAGLPSANTALRSLIDNSLLPQAVIKSRFQESLPKLSTNILMQGWAPTQLNTNNLSATTPAPIASPDEILIETESQIRKRRAAFVELAAPVIVQDTLTTSILNIMKDLVPDVDISVLSYLLTDTVKVSINRNSGLESAMAVLKHLSEVVETTSKVEPVYAYFIPTTTDDFILHYTGTLDAPSITINGIGYPSTPQQRHGTPFV